MTFVTLRLQALPLVAACSPAPLNRFRRAVNVEGPGTWTPTFGLVGRLDIQYWSDPAFNYGLNIPGVFTGTILNHEYLGKTGDEPVTKGNEDNQEDPVTLN